MKDLIQNADLTQISRTLHPDSWHRAKRTSRGFLIDRPGGAEKKQSFSLHHDGTKWRWTDHARGSWGDAHDYLMIHGGMSKQSAWEYLGATTQTYPESQKVSVPKLGSTQTVNQEEPRKEDWKVQPKVWQKPVETPISDEQAVKQQEYFAKLCKTNGVPMPLKRRGVSKKAAVELRLGSDIHNNIHFPILRGTQTVAVKQRVSNPEYGSFKWDTPNHGSPPTITPVVGVPLFTQSDETLEGYYERAFKAVGIENVVCVVLEGHQKAHSAYSSFLDKGKNGFFFVGVDSAGTFRNVPLDFLSESKIRVVAIPDADQRGIDGAEELFRYALNKDQFEFEFDWSSDKLGTKISKSMFKVAEPLEDACDIAGNFGSEVLVNLIMARVTDPKWFMVGRRSDGLPIQDSELVAMVFRAIAGEGQGELAITDVQKLKFLPTSGRMVRKHMKPGKYSKEWWKGRKERTAHTDHENRALDKVADEYGAEVVVRGDNKLVLMGTVAYRTGMRVAAKQINGKWYTMKQQVAGGAKKQIPQKASPNLHTPTYHFSLTGLIINTLRHVCEKTFTTREDLSSIKNPSERDGLRAGSAYMGVPLRMLAMVQIMRTFDQAGEGLKMMALAGWLGTTHATTWRVIGEMEKEGMVTFTASGRRYRKYVLTPEAEEILKRIAEKNKPSQGERQKKRSKTLERDLERRAAWVWENKHLLKTHRFAHMVRWKSIVAKFKEEEKEFIELLKKLGDEVKTGVKELWKEYKGPFEAILRALEGIDKKVSVQKLMSQPMLI
jgi:DNA-binding MarR family transcriptional regulator